MKIIIAGDGYTGGHLARLLSAENEDVVLMGQDRKRLDELDAKHNIMVMEGSGVSPASLRAAGVTDCDLFIGVTPWGNENIVACQLAKALGARRTVARIVNEELITPEMRRVLRDTGIDTVVYPENLVAHEIRTLLRHNGVKQWLELYDGALVIVGVKVAKGSELDGIHLRELMKSKDPFHVAAIKRRGKTIIPKGDDGVEAGDILYLSLLPEVSERVIEMCGRRTIRVRNLLIAGAGKLSRQIVAVLSEGGLKNITVVDSDQARCRKLSLRYPSVTVVNADQRDYRVLCEEGLESCDAFIAANDSSEMNIVGAILAKDSGVPGVIADIEDLQYFAEAENLNIDIVVNKMLLTSSTILQMLLDSKNIRSARCLSLEDADVSEITVAEGSKVTRTQVRNLRLPDGMTIAGLIREGRGMLVDGDTLIRPGDHVVVFSLTGSLHKYDKLFK